jgi:hypothetical protein
MKTATKSRGVARYVHYRNVFSSLKTVEVGMTYWAKTSEETIREFSSSERGLDDREIDERLAKYGHRKRQRW